MRNITVNNKKNTIEMTKTYAKLASQYGTEQYKALQNVRRDYPTYRIVTVSRKNEKPEFKGLTYKFMKNYIKGHDDENQSKMSEFLDLTAKSEEAKNMGIEAQSYAQVKKWFLMSFPAICEFITKRDNLLKTVAENKAKRITEAA